MHATLAEVPLWLDEGLATYFEVPGRNGRSTIHTSRPFAAARRLGIVPSLEALENRGAMTDMGLAEYRDAWAWTHFMLLGPTAAHDELIAYLAGLRSPTPPVPLSLRFRQHEADVQRQFLDHFRSWQR